MGMEASISGEALGLLLGVLGLLVGVVAIGVSLVLYVRATRHLRQEADKLRGLNIMMLHLLDKSGVIEGLKWDEHGNPLIEVGAEVDIRWRVERAAPQAPEEEQEDR
jgi:hypothetical protein